MSFSPNYHRELNELLVEGFYKINEKEFVALAVLATRENGGGGRGDQLLKRVHGGPTPFRSHFPKLLSALGHISKNFCPFKVPF